MNINHNNIIGIIIGTSVLVIALEAQEVVREDREYKKYKMYHRNTPAGCIGEFHWHGKSVTNNGNVQYIHRCNECHTNVLFNVKYPRAETKKP